ncbi:MAG: hypothetical protein WDM85_05050 [Caulobacteraceae bacterium]
MVSAAMSPPVVSMFSDGTLACRALARSIAPVFTSALEPTTWTGAALLAAVTPVCRVPVTITSETLEPAAALLASAVAVASAVASAALAILGAAIPIAISSAVRLPPYINLFTSRSPSVEYRQLSGRVSPKSQLTRRLGVTVAAARNSDLVCRGLVRLKLCVLTHPHSISRLQNQVDRRPP